MAKDNAEKPEIDLNILQNINFDPMKILHENGGKVNKEVTEAIDLKLKEKEDDDTEDDLKDKGTDKNKKVEKKDNKINFDEITLSDEMLEAGFKKVQMEAGTGAGKKTTAKKKDDEEDDELDENGKKKEDAEIDYTNAFAVHYDMMVKSGQWDPIDDFKGTKEDYLRARDFNFTAKIDQGVDAFLDEAFVKNPEGKTFGKKLIMHLASGGRVSDFVTLSAPQELDFKALEDKDDAVATAAAKEILTSYYQSIKWKKADIDKKINQLEKLEGLVDEAKLIQTPYQEAITEEEENHKQYLADQKQKNDKASKTVNTALLTMIDKGHAFGNLKVGLDKKEKDEYKNYIFEPGDKGVPEFSIDLNNHLRKPEFLLFIAAAMKKELYKDPSILADTSKGKDKAMDELEETLTNSLLNKDLKGKQASSGTGSVKGKGKKGEDSVPEFNLEEAIVIHG